MASQGPFLVGSGANVNTGGADWDTPANITADDGSTASVVLGGFATSDYLAGTNCGFTIPAGATIDGIVVELNDLDFPGTPGANRKIDVTKDGTTPVLLDPITVNEAVGWASYGASTDLWGTTWTVAEITASTFGAMLQVSNGGAASQTVLVDAFRITVYYTVPPPGPTLRLTRSNLVLN